MRPSLSTALLALATVAGTVLAVAPSAAATLPGYTWLQGQPAGVDPHGLKVYVFKGSHAAALATATQYAVTQQRRYGVRVSWGGYSSTSTRPFGIVVSQFSSCVHELEGHASASWYVIPGRPNEIIGATVQICPRGFTDSTAILRATLLHELGHAVGLDHYNPIHAGHRQIMNAIVQPEDSTYQAGDIHGLQAVAANTARLAKLLGT
jgi:hypothetical protein